MTLKDIAAKAGVSISTVSRVLNGKDTNAAGPELQKKIWEIARKGNYVPNSMAQGLKKNSPATINHSIACIYARTNDIENDAFFTALTRSLEKEALAYGYVLKYAFTAMDIDNPATRNQIISNPVDGIVILGRCSNALLSFVKKYYRSVVFAGLNPVDAGYDQIICNGAEITYAIMDKLFSKGRKKIGYIGETANEIRYQAYRKYLNEHHKAIESSLIASSKATSEGGYKGAKAILSKSETVDALYCMNDITAIGAIKAVKELGYKIPEDIAVISIDDIEIAQYVSPMLTTAHIPTDEMGNMTAKTLIDRIKGGHTLPMEINLPFTIINRESCD